MQVVPGPLQSGAYPSIHHGTIGTAFPHSSNSSPTARYSHILSPVDTITPLAQLHMHETLSCTPK